MTIEDRLAEHVATLGWKDVPGEARDAFEGLLLDTAAVILAGLGEDQARGIVEGILCWNGESVASVAGRASRVPPTPAAFANGVFAHWCEWDDAHDRSHVHASAVIFPALFAAAEAAGESVSGEEFAAAGVAAFDVACRVGDLLKPLSHWGWMPTGAGGSVGAAAGAARLLGLDTNGIRSAMGLAASNAGLSRQPLVDRVNGKNVLVGIAARNAVDAALLARAGVTGAPHFLTGTYGQQALFAGGGGELEPVFGDLGRRFSIAEVSVKPYPCCRSTHPSIDIVLDLRDESPEAAARIKSAHFTVPQGLYDRCGRPFEPGDNPRVSAQFSIPYTGALAVRHGRIRPAAFAAPAVLSDAAGIADLVPAITVEAVPMPPEAGDPLTPVTGLFRLDDGREVERTTDVIKGSPQRPMTRAEAETKLSDAADGLLSAERRQDLVAAAAATAADGPDALLALLRQAGSASRH